MVALGVDHSNQIAQDVRIEHGEKAGWLAPIALEPRPIHLAFHASLMTQTLFVSFESAGIATQPCGTRS